MPKNQTKPTKLKKTSRSIVFDGALLAKAQVQARRENRSFSNWVNMAIRARFESMNYVTSAPVTPAVKVEVAS